MPKSRDAFRTISEVADWLDTQAHVLRFWESKFPQVKPVKRAGGRRYYRPADMTLLGGIKTLLHDDGMTIKGVQKILREEGVKHVCALSPPVDIDEGLIVDIPLEAPVEPVQDTVSRDISQEVSIEAEPEQQSAEIVPLNRDPEAAPEDTIAPVEEAAAEPPAAEAKTPESFEPEIESAALPEMPDIAEAAALPENGTGEMRPETTAVAPLDPAPTRAGAQADDTDDLTAESPPRTASVPAPETGPEREPEQTAPTPPDLQDTSTEATTDPAVPEAPARETASDPTEKTAAEPVNAPQEPMVTALGADLPQSDPTLDDMPDKPSLLRLLSINPHVISEAQKPELAALRNRLSALYDQMSNAGRS